MNVRNYHVDIDGVRSPRDAVSIAYASNDYLDQQRVLKLFYEEDVGEELLNPLIGCNDMKTKYPIEIIELRFQVAHINHGKFQLFEKFAGATNKARLFMIIL